MGSDEDFSWGIMGELISIVNMNVLNGFMNLTADEVNIIYENCITTKWSSQGRWIEKFL